MANIDCEVTPPERIDPSLVVEGLVFASTSIVQLQADGVTTVTLPALGATWDATSNPQYVLGVQFEYFPTPSGPVSTPKANIADLEWKTTDAIMSNVEYSCRYRAVGQPGVFGEWSTAELITITALFSLGDTDQDLIDFLNSGIGRNLWRFDFHAAVNGASAVGVPPAAPFTTFGSQQMAFTIPGGAPGVKVVVDGKTFGLKTRDGGGYAYQFMAKTTDAGGSTLKVGFRDQSDNPISDLADQTYAITTTPTTFYWENIESDDPDFETAKLEIFYASGGIDGGETVTVTDLMINGEFGIKTAYTPWRPSRDEDDLQRYRTLLESLYAAEKTGAAGMRKQRSDDGSADVYVPATGPSQIVSDASSARTLTASDASKLIIATPGSNQDITVEPDSTFDVPVRTRIELAPIDGSDMTVTAGTGVTIYGATMDIPEGQKGELTKLAADTYLLVVTGSGGGGGGAGLWFGTSAPVDPVAYPMWWDSESGQARLKLYFTDVDSSQWVDATPLMPGPPGDEGPTGPAPWTGTAPWVTATAYSATAPASAVSQAGASYVCLVSHTSGTFATDLAALKWGLIAAKGDPGSAGAAGAIIAPQGRLTPTAGQPVLTAGVTGATSLSYEAFGLGNSLPIYDGAAWSNLTFSTMTLSLDASNHLAEFVYDVFAWNDAGTRKVGAGPAWIATATVTWTSASPGVCSWTAHGLLEGDPVVFTAGTSTPTGITAGTVYYVSSTSLTANSFVVSTTKANAAAGTNVNTSSTGSGTQTATNRTRRRGTGAGTTELVSQDGFMVNANTITLTNGAGAGTSGLAAKTCLYLGSLRCSANGQTGMNLIPSSASGGTDNYLDVYNAYNRVRTVAYSRDSSTNWSYASTVWRPSNNNVKSRITVLDGLGQSVVVGRRQMYGNGYSEAAINRNSTTAAPSVFGQGPGGIGICSCTDEWLPLIGVSYYQAMEASASGSVTFYANETSPTRPHERLTLELEM